MREGGKDGRCVGLTSLPPSCACCLEILGPQSPGAEKASPGRQWDNFSCRTNWPNCAVLLEKLIVAYYFFFALLLIGSDNSQ